MIANTLQVQNKSWSLDFYLTWNCLLCEFVAEYHLFAPTSVPITAAQITALISSIIRATITNFIFPAAMVIHTGLAGRTFMGLLL
jgi:hypothetical protein